MKALVLLVGLGTQSFALSPAEEAKVGERADAVVYRASADAQNSYGALIRTKFQIVVNVVSGKWLALDAAIAVRDLKEACEAQNEFLKTTGSAGRAAMEKAGHSGRLEDCAAQYPNAVGAK